MVEYLRGRVAGFGAAHIVFEAGGVGFRLRVHAPARFRRLAGREVKLSAWLQFTPRRVEMFGFIDDAERGRFEALVGIPGIGPATALKLLPAWDALSGRKGGALPEIDGIGPAKRGRIAKWLARRAGVKPVAATAGEAELVRALRSLGLTAVEARERAVRAVARAPGASLEAQIRLATSKVAR